MNEVPRTFCITLKETPLRTRSFLESATQTGIKAELFYGVFGNKLGVIPKYPNVLETANSEIFMTEGAIGCNLSHFILWNVLKYLPEDEFFIVEDDAEFGEDFKNKFHTVYSKLPSNWEFVYVGWLPYGNDAFPMKVDEGISIRIPSATHAYLVKKSVLDRLQSCILPLQSNIDLTLINKVLPNINYYVFDPSLVNQKSYDNISNSTWTSLVYDWKNDFYNCKQKLLGEVSLGCGWYFGERNESEVWRWSQEKFIINVPKSIDSLSLLCSVPYNNEVIITIGDHEEKMGLKAGTNVLEIFTRGEVQISGTVVNPFVPSKQSEDNNDHRILGICMKKFVIKMGVISIPIELLDLVPDVTSPLLKR